MIRVLYVNHGHSARCGVHDLGRRHANAIASDTVEVAYVEANTIDAYAAAVASATPDVIIVNWMPGIMPWVGPAIRDVSPAVRIAVVHNYTHDTLPQVVDWHVTQGFDYVMALDPAITEPNVRVLVTDRPLPDAAPDVPLADRPRIGSAGFAFPHKDFPAVAREIAATFDDATYALHMPEAYFNGANGDKLYTDGILSAVAIELSKPGLTLDFTDEYLPADELVAAFARNHVNCLFYVPGQPNAGLSSQLDYFVAARRPIMVTDCTMFHHYRQLLAVFPDVRLAQVMEEYDTWQTRAELLYESAATRLRVQAASHLERIAG